MWSIALAGHTRGGFSAVFIRFSRFPMAIPLRDIAAETITAAFFNNWVCLFGTPLTITTDQGTQFESALFKAFLNHISTRRIRTSPYHSASNGLVERYHRTLKAALMCNPQVPWPDLLPLVQLGLRTAYKEGLKVSPAELVFGTTLRIPGDFFVTQDLPCDPQSFLEKHRRRMNAVKPIHTSHHTKSKIFLHKDLAVCTHVFLRSDEVRSPLQPPYTGPYLVVRRLDDRRYVIQINQSEKTISVDRLKPVYITQDDDPPPTHQPEHQQRQVQQPVQQQQPQPHHSTQSNSSSPKKVKFSIVTDEVTGGGE